ncbi:hypothetical protein D3C71_2011630 [compost metagenome]
MWAVPAEGGLASPAVGSESMSACSRAFHCSSILRSGRQPIRPGWMSPAYFTPGTWRELVNMP